MTSTSAPVITDVVVLPILIEFPFSIYWENGVGYVVNVFTSPIRSDCGPYSTAVGPIRELLILLL